MQISVRSKARGKATNVQQMGAAYGLVMVGGRRVRNGINPTRVLAHIILRIVLDLSIQALLGQVILVE